MFYDLDFCVIFFKCRIWIWGVVWNLSLVNILGFYMWCLSVIGLKEYEDVLVELNGL